MNGERERLTAECAALAGLLVRGHPDTYVVEQYVGAHAQDERFDPKDNADRLLLRVATSVPPLRRAAAAYARIFRPNGALQRKLILLLAIMESTAPTHRVFDSVPGGHRVPMTLALVVRSLTWAVALLIGVVVLGPLVLLSREENG